MIELKFTVSEELSKDDLKKLLYNDDYRYAIYEIKDLIRNIIKYEELDGHSIPVEQGYYEIVEKIREKVFEICSKLPEDE